MANGRVFTQSNESDNSLIAFAREADGQLSQRTSIATGGGGDGRPHLTSQGSVILTTDGSRLLVTNAGSDDVSLVGIATEPTLLGTFPAGGSAPKSIAERNGLVYVLNTGERSIVGFRLSETSLEPIDGSRHELGGDADPAQVGFVPDGSALVVTDRGTNAVVVCSVDGDGRIGEPQRTPSPGPTPYGFTFAAGATLVVTEAFGAAKGKAAASSYRVDGGRAQPVTASVGNGRSEICWAVASRDGQHVFTTNFADGAVSRYGVTEDGKLVLEDAVAATAVEGRPGLRDEDLTPDGRFLYAIDADSGRIFGWQVAGGRLNPLGSWNGLPATVAGLAAS